MKSVSNDAGMLLSRARSRFQRSTHRWRLSNAMAAQFRSQQARDFACLLDLDPDVVRWRAAPPPPRDGDDEYQLDS